MKYCYYQNLKPRFRLKCHWLCNHPYFGNLVLLCILVSSIMLAAEDPLNSNSERNKVNNLQNWIGRGSKSLLFADSKLFRLLLHHNFHHRVPFQNNCLWIPASSWKFLSEWVQSSWHCCCGCESYIFCIQVCHSIYILWEYFIRISFNLQSS